VTRVALADRHHRHAIAATFGRQVEVGDLGKLALQQRHEQLVHRHSQNRRLVGRLAGVSGVVDRLAAHRHAVDGEHRELGLLVVVARVVAERAFERVLVAARMIRVRSDVPFHHDLRRGRHTQGAAERRRHLRTAAAQQARELVLRKRIGHRCHGPQQRRRVGAQRHAHRIRLARKRDAVLPEILRAAAMRQPAHDDAVARDHLLAVDAQVLARLVGPLRDHQPPGDERRRVAGPAVLHRQFPQVDVVALPDDLLARRIAHFARRHVPQGPDQAAETDHVLEALRRLGLLQRGECLTERPQLAQVVHTHRTGDTLRRAEQIAEHRHRVARRAFEKYGRAVGAQHAVAQRSHLEVRRDGLADATQVAASFQLGDEFAQVAISHGASR